MKQFKWIGILIAVLALVVITLYQMNQLREIRAAEARSISDYEAVLADNKRLEQLHSETKSMSSEQQMLFRIHEILASLLHKYNRAIPDQYFSELNRLLFLNEQPTRNSLAFRIWVPEDVKVMLHIDEVVGAGDDQFAPPPKQSDVEDIPEMLKRDKKWHVIEDGGWHHFKGSSDGQRMVLTHNRNVLRSHDISEFAAWKDYGSSSSGNSPKLVECNESKFGQLLKLHQRFLWIRQSAADPPSLAGQSKKKQADKYFGFSVTSLVVLPK